MHKHGMSLMFFLWLFISTAALAQAPPGVNECSPSNPLREAAPDPLPHVQPVFEEAEFWIGRRPGAEKILLNRQEIEKVNREALRSDPEAVDIFSMAEGIDSAFLMKILSADQQRYAQLKLYDLTNRPLPADHTARLFSSMNLRGIPPVLKPVYGIATRKANLRVLPTEELVMDRPFDYAFDRLQSDRLEEGRPLAVLHHTVDRDWLFVETGGARGWVRPGDVAVGTREEIVRFASAEPLVVIGDGVPFYGDRERTRFVFDLPMGARLPFAGRDGDLCKIHLPVRGGGGRLVIADGYVRAGTDVHEGYLPYTHAAVMKQAFRLRGSRYSWGGLQDGRDCSRFIMDVFRCFGFRMPRDSYRQAAFGGDRRLDAAKRTEHDKIEFLRRFEHAPTLLYMKGHIMLLLGVVDGRVYAIHSYWDYGSPERPEVLYHVGRVAVTDLSLGKNGEGNLLHWITSVIPLQ